MKSNQLGTQPSGSGIFIDVRTIIELLLYQQFEDATGDKVGLDTENDLQNLCLDELIVVGWDIFSGDICFGHEKIPWAPFSPGVWGISS